MANGKAQITDLNLTAIDANLSDYLSDIRPYEGFVQCNSPWIGGLLNNVYKKKVEGLPEGHKLVKVHNGNIYSLKAVEKQKNDVTYLTNEFYKNGTLIKDINPKRPYINNYDDSENIVRKIDKNKLEVKFNIDEDPFTVVRDDNFSFAFARVAWQDLSLIVTVYPEESKTLSELSDNETGMVSYFFTNRGLVQTKTGLEATPIIGGAFNEMDASLEAVLTGYVHNFDTDIYSVRIDSTSFTIHYKYWNINTQTYERLGIIFGYNYYGDIQVFCVGNICTDVGATKWTRGEAIPIYSSEIPFMLYYNEVMSGISINNSLITSDLDSVFYVKNQNGLKIDYYDTQGNAKELSFGYPENNIADFFFVDNYICFVTNDYKNTIDLNNDEFFCRSDDYNDRLLIKDTGTLVSGMFVTGWNVNPNLKNIHAFSSVYPQRAMNYPSSLTGGDCILMDLYWYRYFYERERYPGVEPSLVKYWHPLEIYTSNSIGENAKYKTSYIGLSSLGGANYSYLVKDSILKDTLFSVSSDGNIIYPVTALSDIKETYLNEYFSEESIGNYFLTKNQKQELLFGYYDFSFTELQNMFLTQGQFYGLNNKYIFSVSLDNSTANINGVIGNKQDLLFLGAFPTMALFWSKLDKSLYAFTGDAILQKTKEAYRINQIYNVYCDPARLTMIISTDIGVIIIYQNQVMVLDEMTEPIEHIYYDSNSYYLDDLALSLSEQEGYEPQNIKLHTEYYGVGAGVKSVNDCVYLRVAKGKNANGKVKFQSFVLNDKTTASEEKEIVLNDSMFDTVSGSAYIKYQPKNQAGLGFSVKVETTNPIVSMSIGHSPESIGNTINKL